MAEFDEQSHARLVGNALIALAVVAFGIEVAGFLPDEAIDLPPHFFGPGGAALAGLVFLGGGVWLRRSGGGGE
jgi:hypothetical protein